MKLEELSVFFPAYNEQGNIIKTVEEAYQVIPKYAERFEIIVINDGSKDKTKEKLEELLRKHPDLKVVSHAKNRGYGAALKSGFSGSRFKYVFFTDGDGQFDIEEIGKLVNLIGNCDIAAGFRLGRKDPAYRILNAKAYNFLVKILFGLSVKDIDCAFKIIRKEVLDTVDLKSESQFISAELLIKAKNKNFIAKQCGVRHFPREKGKATGNKPQVIINSFKELFRLWKELRQQEI